MTARVVAWALLGILAEFGCLLALVSLAGGRL